MFIDDLGAGPAVLGRALMLIKQRLGHHGEVARA